jgi:hypothetical protein
MASAVPETKKPEKRFLPQQSSLTDALFELAGAAPDVVSAALSMRAKKKGDPKVPFSTGENVA